LRKNCQCWFQRGDKRQKNARFLLRAKKARAVEQGTVACNAWLLGSIFIIGKKNVFFCPCEKNSAVNWYIWGRSSSYARARGGKMKGEKNEGMVGKVQGKDVESILSSIIKWREAKGSRWLFEVD